MVAHINHNLWGPCGAEASSNTSFPISTLRKATIPFHGPGNLSSGKVFFRVLGGRHQPLLLLAAPRRKSTMSKKKITSWFFFFSEIFFFVSDIFFFCWLAGPITWRLLSKPLNRAESRRWRKRKLRRYFFFREIFLFDTYFSSSAGWPAQSRGRS